MLTMWKVAGYFSRGAAGEYSLSDFYRWLANDRRETAEAAWDDGYMATGGLGHHEREATNPHRREETP